MSCKVEKTKNANESKLTITIGAEKFENAIKRVYAKNAKYFNIPGFRKGKAPQNIVEKYYGKEIFYEDAFNDIVDDEYKKALEESKLDVVGKAKIDIDKMEKGQDVIFTAIVPTKPDVELGKYKGIEVEKIEYIVEDSDIEDELKSMQEKNAREVESKDPIKNGDIAIIDFEGFVDGVAFNGGKSENYSLEIGSGSFIPGFEDQLIGMKSEEEKEIAVKFPEDYHANNLAGKDATFKVKVHDIKKKEYPKIDDDFAQDVSEFDTLQELKNSIRESKVNENVQRAKSEKEEAILTTITSEMKVDIPEGMIEAEIDRMLQDIEQRLSYQGIKFERYLQLINKTEKEIREEYKEQAIEQIKVRLALGKIIELEKIEASEREIKDKIEELATTYKTSVEDLKKNENLDKYVKEEIETGKAIDFLVENAKEKKPTAKKETAEKAESKKKK